MEIVGTLNDWYLSDWYGEDKPVIVGRIEGDIHGRFPDGSIIHTSEVGGFTEEFSAGDIIKTLNSVYRLGDKSDKHYF